MSLLDKLKLNAQIARKYSKTELDKIETKLREEQYRKMKAQQNIDPDNIRRNLFQKISQEFSSIKDEVCNSLKSEMIETEIAILNLIKDELNIPLIKKRTCWYNKDISFAEIEDLIQIFLPVLKNFKEISENPEITKRQQGNAYTYYESLFNNLINLDARFALFAPLKSLRKTGVMDKVDSLPDYVKSSILEKKDKLEEDAQKDYVSEHSICEFDPQDSRVQKANQIDKKLNELRNIACKKIAVATIDMGDKLFNLIKSELKLNPLDPPVVSDDEIKKVLQSCSVTKKNLERLSKNTQVSQVAGWGDKNPYFTMFYNLITLEPKFALHDAPIEVLSRLDLNFERLSESDKNILFSFLRIKGVFDNEEYFKKYQKVFISQISKFHVTL